MTSLQSDHAIIDVPNPIDEAEILAGVNQWTFERQNDELIILLDGAYTAMQMRLFWRSDYKTLQLANVIDLKVPGDKQNEMYKAIGLINERLWLGHFEYWTQDNSLLFRHASLANDPMEGGISEEHIATLIETAITESEKFYPVFQFILWGGMSAEDAIEATMLESQGSA